MKPAEREGDAGVTSPSHRARSASDACVFCGGAACGEHVACSRCLRSRERGGVTWLTRLESLGLATARQVAAIESGFVAQDENSRRQAELRLEILAAVVGRAPAVEPPDIAEAKARLAATVGATGPVFRAGVQILETMQDSGPRHPSWLLWGPPGTGKTQLARFVSELLGLPLYVEHLSSAAGRMTISGCEASYRAATPGAFASAIAHHGTSRFAVLFDEIDKFAGISEDSSPHAALLSALDDQCDAFPDRFLGVEPQWRLDLRNVTVIATANDLHRVPEPLQSRMQMIELPAWNSPEKADLFDRVFGERCNSTGMPVELTSDAKRFVVDRRREPGVRELLVDIDRIERAIRRDPLALNDGAVTTRWLSHLFPPAPAAPVASTLASIERSVGPGVVRGAVWTDAGWAEIRCSAVPNGDRWAGHLDALRTERDHFVLHWIPIISKLLGLAVPPCSLHIEPPWCSEIAAPWLPVTMLGAVYSAVSGVPADPTTMSLVGADLEGRLTARGNLSAPQLAGLTAIGVTTVVVAELPDPGDPTWARDDLPELRQAATIAHLLEALVPDAGRNPHAPCETRDLHSGGYL